MLISRTLLLAFSAFFVAACSSGDFAGEVPRKAPYTRFQLLNGEYTPLVAYEGKVVPVLFWGSWCRYSRSVLPEFAALAEKLSNKRNIQFIAASVDSLDEQEKVFAAIKKLPASRLILGFSGNEGQDEAFVSFQGEDVPLIFVIDERGTIVAKGREVDTIEEYLEGRGLL